MRILSVMIQLNKRWNPSQLTVRLTGISIVTFLLFLPIHASFSQIIPTFGPEKKVTLLGWQSDAMEPFISTDGTTLFFNSLNSGGNTNLHYASFINDSTFQWEGIVNGTFDPASSHLDGVPSMDSAGNFYWVSLRGYPTFPDNLHRGKFAGGQVTQVNRVHGNFNIPVFSSPFGWLIMDAAITPKGNQLLYCNSLFDFSNNVCNGIPCQSILGMAEKTNDSTFMKMGSSDSVFSEVNDTASYIIYAPQLTRDGLELYFTRLLKGSFNTEICVSVRNQAAGKFGSPSVIWSNPGFVPEAASLSLDKQKLYYHQKDNSGQYKIWLRYRSPLTASDETFRQKRFRVFPNPSSDRLLIEVPDSRLPFTVRMYSSTGQLVYQSANEFTVPIGRFPSGVYHFSIVQNGEHWNSILMKE